MTNEQAINQLKVIRSEFAVDMRLNDVEAFDMAIEALQQGCEKVTEGCDDLISRQRILRIITGAYVKSKDIDSFYALLQTAFENILPDARVEQDCVLKQFGDCSYAETGCSDCAITAKIRKALKTAQPERKGNWSIKNGELAIWDVCSECGRMVIHRAPFYNYCPNCGADMRGDQNAD